MSEPSKHPHFACAKCEANSMFNQVLMLVFLVFIPFVSAERAIALAILFFACGYEPRRRQ